MDETKHTMGGKPDMIGLCPFCICTTVRYVLGKHRTKMGHLLTTLALGQPFGIDCASLGHRIEELTPGVQVNYQQMPVHRLLMAAETALGTFVLPGGG